jgi:hypothetical protein
LEIPVIAAPVLGKNVEAVPAPALDLILYIKQVKKFFKRTIVSIRAEVMLTLGYL